jgi:hypothetical protein
MPQFHDIVLLKLKFKQLSSVKLVTLGFSYKANPLKSHAC